jgi:hypothetical protein
VRGEVPDARIHALRAFPDARRPPGSDPSRILRRREDQVPVWLRVLLGVGGIGLLGAVLITAAVFEFTWMRFRRWDTLP